MAKYLITGGAGFIGSNLTARLLSEGHEVVCVDNFDAFYDIAIKHKNISVFKDNDAYTLEEGDIRDYDFMRGLFTRHKFKQVIHLAARAGVRPSIVDPLLYNDVNIKGTLNILECLKEFKIPKMIFASSSSVYGTNKKVPFAEDDLIQKTISPYAVTKLAGEMFCHSYAHLYGISIAALRFFTVYGPSQRPEMAIHKFTDAVFKGKKIPMFGDGSSRRDYTYVEDIVEGIVASMKADFKFEIFNLGNCNTISLKDLITQIEIAAGKKAIIEQLSAQPGDVPITYADITKPKEMLGYNPQTPIEEGIVKFVNWYKEYNSMEI